MLEEKAVENERPDGRETDTDRIDRRRKRRGIGLRRQTSCVVYGATHIDRSLRTDGEFGKNETSIGGNWSKD